MQVKRAFVWGRSNRKSTTYVVLTLSNDGPIVGPWTLKAIVSSN